MEKVINFVTKMKKIIFKNTILVRKIAIILVGIIAIIIVASVLKGGNNDTSSGNAFNNGLAVQDDKWI